MRRIFACYVHIMSRARIVEGVGEMSSSRNAHVHARHSTRACDTAASGSDVACAKIDSTSIEAANIEAANIDATNIDRALRRIATRRARLDAEEARWLRRAHERAIWPKLGYVTALEYLEDIFGYSPRTAHERLRVAQELGGLPLLEAELEAGRLPYSIDGAPFLWSWRGAEETVNAVARAQARNASPSMMSTIERVR